MAWTEGERGCKSPDECRAMTQNQGTYVPRSPEDFLKSTPLVGATGVLYAPRSADGIRLYLHRRNQLCCFTI